MGSLNPSHELCLNSNPIFIPKSMSQLIRQVSEMSSVTEKIFQVDDLVNRLEIETQKIEAFKRELPLSMLLINNAIVALKEESMELKKSSNVEPVLEEFIPLKNSCDIDDDSKVEITTLQKDNGDKKNWLSSTQLWNSNENLNQKTNSVSESIKKKAEEEDAGISIFSPETKNQMRGNGLFTEIDGKSRLISCSTPNVKSNIRINSTSRKQRRCWSTELHRRFVNALQQLGGSQVATPKQIRDLMQVDGLTNDEVKSHLQKYRLHTRTLPSSTTNPSKCNNSQSGSPDGPLENDRNNMDDEEDEKSENYLWNGNL